MIAQAEPDLEDVALLLALGFGDQAVVRALAGGCCIPQSKASASAPPLAVAQAQAYHGCSQPAVVAHANTAL